MEVRCKRVLVVGLARSGLAVARCLSRRGAAVMATDLRHPAEFSAEIKDLMQQKIGLELGCHREQTFLRPDLIVVSPGVPADIPPLRLARARGIPVVSEVEVAGWYLEGRLAGITGTNGKTTVTALAGKILETSGFDPFVGGNIGVPLISALERVPPPSVLVVELSSFQLETVDSFRPHVAVLLNLTPNHLDRHPSFEAYVQAKARIFRNQRSEDFAVLNADDANVMKLAPSIRSRKVFFSRRRELPDGLFVSGGRIRYRIHHLERALLEVSDVRLRGGFNLENVLAACAMGCVLGADFAALRLAVRDFQGVEHRLEFVREIGGVAFYNDSKATSVDAAAKALSTFDHGVHLILGGKDKGAPYAPLKSLLKGRVREVLTIGAAAARIEQELGGAAELVHAGTLEAAVRKAFEWAAPGDVILLSPACSSYDQFENFEQRGRLFKDIVGELADEFVPRAVSSGAAVVSEPSSITQSEPGVTRAEGLFDGGPQAADRPHAAANEAGPSIQEASPASDDREPAQQPSDEPAVIPRPQVARELEYVYEVSAEEVFGSDEPRNFAMSDAGENEAEEERTWSEPETPADEALAYEVRQAAGSADAPPRFGKGRKAQFPSSKERQGN
jgi:UDP-N-acetylmuramoylalanine--D-glutamate ligase